ncbi:3-oxoacyl-[acyl-carrier-protein] synthase-1 [Paucimonas lemoignei]|uniref:3-oxoacyl-[acyl-carrier-protein] synthase-1 n=1 Tax=Paucimonas lemoignei TaxID=29443 RepID=A0A4R3HT61_PAULE|nr:beta-ketoacyl synthase N-terminal-like domain-containing protein [Paucimonas lemoignei]TCS36337.1 3-oxoacyl-[acyl-carrier-protein] synthase-1 [Paucimonas lemoignei]
MTPVYIAGFGLASSLGVNLTDAVQNILRPPAPGLRTIKGLDLPLPYFSIPHSSANWHARCASLIRQVVDEAGANRRTGALYIASASLYVGAMESGEPHASSLPVFLAELAGMLDWHGPVHLINTSCTSSLNAVLTARDAMFADAVEDAVIVGLELENLLTLAGFAGMKLLSNTASRPFAVDRDGLVLGEAVAALRLSRQHGRWRMRGGAQVIDSSQLSGASDAACRIMLQQALADANLHSNQIDLIKVQAAGSILNDAIEARALTESFSAVPHLLSLKPLIGHTLGASGAAEIALLLAMLEQQQWPAIPVEMDPELGVQLAAQRPAQLRHILACILGFGGSHSCIAIEDTEASDERQVL